MASLLPSGGGGYQITVANGPAANERSITSIGYILRNGAALPGAPPIPLADIVGQRTVQIVVSSVGAINPPGAMAVGGTVQIAGNSTVNGNSATCGNKAGVTISSVSPTGQTNTINISNQSTVTGTPPTSTIPISDFSQYALSPSDLVALKALAQASGRYIKPTSSSAVKLTLNNQLTFIDTINAQAFSNSSPGQPYSNFDATTDASKLANVTVEVNGTGSGWLIVMGSLKITANMTFSGLIYTYNDFNSSQTNITVNGAIMSQNAVDSIATVIDTAIHDSTVTYDCAALRNLGTGVSAGYTLKPGSWKSCPVGAC